MLRVCAAVAVVGLGAVGILADAACAALAEGRLFPAGLAQVEWQQFSAQGFRRPVSGILFGSDNPTCCGVPLGGLGTGCLDIEPEGVLGFSSVFYPSLNVPPTPYKTLRNPKLLTPFLGLSVGGRTWVLADEKFIKGGEFLTCADPCDPFGKGGYLNFPDYVAHWTVRVPPTVGVRPATGIEYWGHYPVVDMEYHTDAPVGVALRAWSPFIPGDPAASNIPAAVFEVRLRNLTGDAQRGVIAFNFPGPNEAEAGADSCVRAKVAERGLAGISVAGPRAQYFLGVIGRSPVVVGGDLSRSPEGWAGLARLAPGTDTEAAASGDRGASVAVPFRLQGHREEIVRFVLAWFLTYYTGGPWTDAGGFDRVEWGPPPYPIPGRETDEGERYVPMYATRYEGPVDVARKLARTHRSLLRRVLAWQEVIYDAEEYPVWLRDSLINNLALIPEDSFWAAPRGKIAHWAYPTGAFHLTENPRTCSITGCIVSNYYGDLPIAFFFPDLERSILRAYQSQVRPDGAVPFVWASLDVTKPSYEHLIPLNGPCFVDLVHRLWLRTGDRTVVEEFYPTVKKTTAFTMNLKKGPGGLISVHQEGGGQEWWEHTPVYGMVPHLAGVRLASLRMAENMAKEVGDTAFAQQCREWYEEASADLEGQLWNPEANSYLFFDDPATGKRSDLIMSSQLDGQWMANLHGLPGVFRQDRVETVLETIKETCLVDVGLAGFSDPKEGAQLTLYGTFPPEIHIVAMTYMYNGFPELGLEIARRNHANMVRRHGHPWDLPNLIRCDTGERTYGVDYYQNMVLWGVPVAMQNQDVRAFCARGGLVDRILQAGREDRGSRIVIRCPPRRISGTHPTEQSRRTEFRSPFPVPR